MANHLQNGLTTSSSKPSPIKEDQLSDEATVSLQAESILHNLTFPMVLKTALELGVIDTIAGADEGVWLSSSDIALRLPTVPTNPEAPALLDRLLILLASHSLLKYRLVESSDQTGKTERVYAAEPVCFFFLNHGDSSGSLASLFMVALSNVFLNTWTHLKDVILEGQDAFTSAHGKSDMANWLSCTHHIQEVLGSKPCLTILHPLFNSPGSAPASKYPHIKGINYDLASVLSHAPLYPGVEHISGDMFKEIPKGDAILMKWILHDWTDEDCIKILKNCWKSLSERGKVILVDMIMPEEPYNNDPSSKIVLSMDIIMLTQLSGGKERSFAQIKNLASASGFLHCEIICYAYSYRVIELHK